MNRQVKKINLLLANIFEIKFSKTFQANKNRNFYGVKP